jgi:hypothetical protein
MCAIDSALIGFSAMSSLAIARLRHVDTSDLTGVIVLGAATSGFIAGSKYTGLWLIGILASVILAGRSLRRPVRTALLFSALAVIVASPWYIRNGWLTGDPLYPATKGLLGDTEARWALDRLQRDVQTIGLGWHAPAELVMALVRTPGRFGAGAETGILLPLGALALLAGALRRSELRPWVLACTLYIPLWIGTTGVMRYLYPVFPLCALGIAWTIGLILERGRHTRIALGAMVFLATVPLYQSVLVLNELYVGRDVAALWSGALSQEDYLTHRLAYYPATQWMNRHTDRQAGVLYLGETRLLYLDRPVKLASAYDAGKTARLLELGAPHFIAQLRSQGITHILINGHEINRLRASYDYLSLSDDAERQLRAALQDCRILFRQSGVQICELPGAQVS